MRRTKWTGGVKENKRLKDGRWLNKATKFKPKLSLSNENKKVAEMLFDSLEMERGYTVEKKLQTFERLLANLLRDNKHPVRISMNQNTWSKYQYKNISGAITNQIHKLRKHKLIGMKKGMHIQGKPARETRIWANTSLLKLFPCADSNAVRWDPFELVEVWTKERVTSRYNGEQITVRKQISYTDTAEVRRIRKILSKVNKLNNEADVMFIEGKKNLRLNTALIAKFVDKLTQGGRLYTEGISYYQGLSSTDRQEITINGKPTVEVDYSALHPMLLYAAKGIQYRDDPYSVVNDNPIARPFLKQILLRMINCRNKHDAMSSSGIWWSQQKKSEKNALDDIGLIDSRPLIEKFMEIHKPIAHYLCSGKETGLRLMNKDSKIALDVLNHFAKQNISILCMHDSFLVDKTFADELVSTMRKMYRKHTKTLEYVNGFRCKIKRSDKS